MCLSVHGISIVMQNLHETIINIAQDFSGIDHANPLSPNGQGGTRIVASKDAASTRIIYYKLELIAYKILDPRMSFLLSIMNEDGQFIDQNGILR